MEAAGLCAPSQAGFRSATSTLHPEFTLQHLLECAPPAAAARLLLPWTPLDSQGAYKRVPRLLIWQALARLGVHGATLRISDRCTPTRRTQPAWAGAAALACH